MQFIWVWNARPVSSSPRLCLQESGTQDITIYEKLEGLKQLKKKNLTHRISSNKNQRHERGAVVKNHSHHTGRRTRVGFLKADRAAFARRDQINRCEVALMYKVATSRSSLSSRSEWVGMFSWFFSVGISTEIFLSLANLKRPQIPSSMKPNALHISERIARRTSVCRGFKSRATLVAD